MKADRFLNIVEYIRGIIKGTVYEDNTYVVGGAVRDYVMGNDIKDIDIVVELEDGGVRFAEYIRDNGYAKGQVITYPNYGTAMFVFKEYPEYEIECVHTRGEQYHDMNTRNPTVSYAGLYDDCFRRDLTMNALYMSIHTGEILDLTGKGISDIENRICRVTNDNPDVVFSDDSLRILRCIRFSVRYGFTIEEKTLQSMIDNVDRLDIISRERITSEFSKIITSQNPAEGIRCLKHIGALKYVLPELEDMIGVKQNAYHFGDVYEHTVSAVEHCSNNELSVRLACVLHDVGKLVTQTSDERGCIHFYGHEDAGAKIAEMIMARMRYPKDLAKEVSFYVKHHMITKNWGDDLSHMKIKSLRKLEYICRTKERFDRLLDVIDADNKAHAPEHCLPNQAGMIKDYVNNVNHADMFGYVLPVDGYDVMNALGISQGREIKKYLDHCIKIAFMNPAITKDELLRHVKTDKIKGIVNN